MKSSSDTASEDEVEEPCKPIVSEQDKTKEAPASKTENELSTSSSSCNLSCILIVLVVVVALVGICVWHILYAPYVAKKENEIEIEKYLNYWKMQYPNQEEKLWSVIKSQIEEFSSDDSTSPLIFVMVYNKADKTAKLLATAVSSRAVEMKHQNDECGDTDAHKLEGNDPHITEGYLLETTLSNITRCKKLIIYNIEKLLPSAAADLHSLLDPDYPNVKSAVYIFTLKADKLNQSIYQTVGDILKKQWGSGLKCDRLEPLLSRIVNFVNIIPEPVFEQL